MIIASISEQSAAPLALHNGCVQAEAEGGFEQRRSEQEIKDLLVLSYDHQGWIEGCHLRTENDKRERE